MKSSWKYFLIISLISFLSFERESTKEKVTLPVVIKEGKSEIKYTPKNDDEIIFEGTVIATDRKFYQNTIYLSCVVEVNSVFKGSIDERVIEVFVLGMDISHGQIGLPPKNSTAIFKIKDHEKGNYGKELIELTPFKLYAGVGQIQTLFPKSIYDYKTVHIEKDVYQKLESESGRKRENIFLPATIDEVAIEYSKRNKLLLPNRKKGMVYKLSPVQASKRENYIGFHVHMASTNSVAYFDSGELIIEYNVKAFGDSIISKNRLVYDIPRNHRIGSASRDNAVPEQFDVSLKDIASDRFKIEWKNRGGMDSCLQLFPAEKGIHSATLYFRPIVEDEPINVKLTGIDTANLQYDYERDEILPFEYTATDEIQYYQAKDLLPAIITDIYPSKVLQVGDTVALSGKNFRRNSEVLIYAKGKRGHYRRRRVPSNYVLTRSDTLIEMIIPGLALSNKASDLSEEWYPTSGKIKISKGYGQFRVMTWSNEEIRIKNTEPTIKR